MEWTSSYICVWFFPRNAIPNNIKTNTPDPSTWGKPQANFQGNCDFGSKFRDHSIVIDTTFCGDVSIIG